MPAFNRVMLMGNLTRDPELKTFAGGSVCNFGLAVNQPYKDKSGQKVDDVLFIDCEAWSRTGELVNEYCRKGSPVFIEGKLKLNQWNDRDGQKRSKVVVSIQTVQFLGKRGGDSEDAQGTQDSRGPAREHPAAPPKDDEIPF